MVTRSRNTHFTQNRSRPNRAWSSHFEAATTSVGPSTKVLLGSFGLSNVNIDETALRVVGMLSVASDQTAVSEHIVGALGLIRVSDTALAAGAASIPGPITDAGDDGWFVYQVIS